MTSDSTSSSLVDAKESLDIVCEISKLLNTGLDRESLANCVRLIEAGVNPEALAVAVHDLKENAKAAKENRDKPAATASTNTGSCSSSSK